MRDPLAPLPLRILIGPLYEPGLLGAYLASPSIRSVSFRPSEVEITEPVRIDPRLFSGTYALEPGRLRAWIEAELRAWQPDVLIWLAPTHLGLPPDILDLPLPKVALMHDWHLNGAA